MNKNRYIPTLLQIQIWETSWDNWMMNNPHSSAYYNDFRIKDRDFGNSFIYSIISNLFQVNMHIAIDTAGSSSHALFCNTKWHYMALK